jgi:sulfoxide reductase catalytic subunit YedY
MSRRPWEIPQRDATPESVYINRRKFLLSLGAQGLGAVGWLAGCSSHDERVKSPSDVASVIGPVDPLAAAAESQRILPNPNFAEIDRPLTRLSDAITYNNFIEFAFGKDVWRWVEFFTTHPWTVEVAGLVRRPKVYDLDELVRRMPLEERIYRHRCVEAWAMAVPWTGFAMRALINEVEPLTGMYGGPLYKQNGAPIRLAVPWKYGFKSIKSITRIEFTSEQPATFWNTTIPREYGFEANVDPEVPHPRWSQKEEWMLGTEEVYSTQPYNGYGEY